MNTLDRKKKWMFTVAAGIIGLAGFGIWNTAASCAQYADAQTADSVQVSGVSDIGVVPAPDSADLIPDGTGCPGSCGGCGLCTRGQYQQTIQNLPGQSDLIEKGYQLVVEEGRKIMRKTIIAVLAVLLLTGIAGTFWGTSIAEAASSIWNSCPKNRINCAYPGDCHSYIDTNNDSVCDRSQSAPQAVTTARAAATSSQAGSQTTAAAVNPTINEVAEATPTANVTAVASTSSRSYYFIPILIAVALLYAATWVLASRKAIKAVTHRRIWNIILLASMAVSAVLGLFLILSIDFNINISLPFNMLFWHVEAGIALGIVGLFHILWHWRYFVKIFQTGEKEKRGAST
jgi:hypothetical protein